VIAPLPAREIRTLTPSRAGAARRCAVGARALAQASLVASAFAAGPELGAQSAAPSSPPDLLLVDGKVFTADPAHPWAQAVAIRGDRIVAVGTTQEVARLAGPSTRRLPLGGRTVVPGFDDAHAHVGYAALPGVALTVDPSPTPDPALDAVLVSIAAAARRAPAGAWLTVRIGGRVFDDPRATRFVLDSVAPAHRVWLRGWSGHGGILNTAALRSVGLLDTADQPGGWLTRDVTGTPVGRIDEYAIYLTDHRLSVAQGDSLLGRAIRAYGDAGLPLGITSVQDMAIAYDLASARNVARRGEAMRVRHRVIRVPFPGIEGGWRSAWSVAGRDTGLAATMHVSGVKWILDGTPIERLALMRAPYADRAGWHGRANFHFDTLRAILRDALTRRWQPHLHAVGDSTIALVIAAMRAEAPDSAWRRLRPRLEHADALGRDQLAAVRALGMVIVQNPSHLAIPDVMTARWGAQRLRTIDMMRTLADSGIPLAIGSDGPREPGLNIMFATTHPNVPGEALTREQAVAAYTRGAAYAAFAERERGTLAPGMLADLAVLSQDVFTVPPNALPTTTSVLTIVGGRILHDAMTGAQPPTSPAR
jgi:hypothetical protein